SFIFSSSAASSLAYDHHHLISQSSSSSFKSQSPKFRCHLPTLLRPPPDFNSRFPLLSSLHPNLPRSDDSTVLDLDLNLGIFQTTIQPSFIKLVSAIFQTRQRLRPPTWRRYFGRWRREGA
ncbi:hypothetical protein LINPERHAP1_LOCUS14965, partial [Linum perenne]